MAEANELRQIMKDIQSAFEKARNEIFESIRKVRWAQETTRLGDLRCELDVMAFKIYMRHLKKKYKMLFYCEEEEKQIQRVRPDDHRYFAILDSIDGTVNMLFDLPFGVNIAFGAVEKTRNDFKIGDIEGVFVADYLTKKAFKWINGGTVQVDPPRFQGGAFTKTQETMGRPHIIGNRRVYEVPDEVSYVGRGNPSGKERQEMLLRAFRSVFPGAQRRAIDCTGLRMLEILNENLFAYGDWRHAAYIWDTIPSIKLILESKEDIHVLDGSLRPYSNDTIIMKKNYEGYYEPEDTGREVAILRGQDRRKLTAYFRNRPVFIIHGRDKTTAQIVKDFITSKFKFECTILDEKTSGSMTVIEKLEKYSMAEMAIVLLTPDDKGNLNQAKQKLKSRARQNVIFEMGLFYGLIGRGNVIALNAGVEELPSDIGGIIAVYIDKNGAWRQGLEKEISNIVSWRTTL